jgi:hypothetical protein
MAGSAAYFCNVNNNGNPNNTSATNANVRVPLCFQSSGQSKYAGNRRNPCQIGMSQHPFRKDKPTPR